MNEILVTEREEIEKERREKKERQRRKRRIHAGLQIILVFPN